MGFRVIIVGCGPVGLAMARSLELAGIDYVVLEKNDEIAPDMGFGIALYPQSMRLLDQFGLLDQVLEEGWHYRFKTNYSPEGKTVEDNEMMGTVKEWHGHPWQYMPRRTLLKILHESISDRDTKIRTGKRVASIKVHDTGVEVTCEDGTIEQGSIIIGCDGIRSIARTEMDRLERAETGRATNETKPFKIYYKALIGRSKSVEHLELNKAHETRGKHKAYQVFPSKLGCWWFAYIRVPEGHKEQRYTQEDAEAAAEALRDDVVAPGGLTFGDLWDARSEGAMWDLHEGSVSKWHHKGRIVLLGDSVHKFAPTAGNGLNTGWQGVSELVNLLRREMMNDQEPSSKRLEAAFKTYQSRRKPISKVAEGVSWFYLRTIVWHNPMYRCLDWMAPYLGGDMTIFKMLSKPCIRSAVVLEYVEEPNLPPSKKPWKNAQVKLGKSEEVTLGVK